MACPSALIAPFWPASTGVMPLPLVPPQGRAWYEPDVVQVARTETRIHPLRVLFVRWRADQVTTDVPSSKESS